MSEEAAEIKYRGYICTVHLYSLPPECDWGPKCGWFACAHNSAHNGAPSVIDVAEGDASEYKSLDSVVEICRAALYKAVNRIYRKRRKVTENG